MRISIKTTKGRKQKERSIITSITIEYSNQCTVSSLFDTIISMKNIILTGIKHSGKSTVGKALAAAASLYFYDVDAVIEETEKISVRSLYTEQGEAGFKKAEYQAVIKILTLIENNQQSGKAVISTGGGICANDKALSLLRENGILVFLDVSEEVSVSRIIENSKRSGSYPAYISRHNPETEEDVRRIYHTFYTERVSLYKKLADISIEADTGSDYHASVQENCRKILSYLPNHSI